MIESGADNHDQVDRWIGTVLLGGLLLSIGVMVAGLVVAAARGGETGTVLPLQRVLPALGNGSAPAVLDLGILLLFATPLAGVVAALISFALHRNARFVVISVALLVLLAVGFAVALR
jgi:uncharacterized membrane protein